MATIQTLYLGDLRTEITHVQSGNKVMTDAPTDNNGKGEYISPTDMVAAALGSCMLTLMALAARRLEIELKGTRVEIQKVMAANPRRIAEIKCGLVRPCRTINAWYLLQLVVMVSMQNIRTTAISRNCTKMCIRN